MPMLFHYSLRRLTMDLSDSNEAENNLQRMFVHLKSISYKYKILAYCSLPVN